MMNTSSRAVIEVQAAIAQRALTLFDEAGIPVTKLELLMDVDNVHAICPLRLRELLEASDGDFAHDLMGIYRHFNRQTKQMQDGFTPRYAQRYAQVVTTEPQPKTHTEAINEATGYRQGSVNVWRIYQESKGEREAADAVLRNAASHCRQHVPVPGYSPTHPDSQAAALLESLRPLVYQPPPYSAATIAAAEERLRIGNTPEDEEYDEAPDADGEAIDQAAEGIASGQPFTLEEGEKQMHVSPAGEDEDDDCGEVEERGHRHNPDFCAKCGGVCQFDDQGEPLRQPSFY